MREVSMSTAGSKLENKIAEMRQRFDQSFALALTEQAIKPEPMLAITVEGEPFALRVHEISGLAVSEEKIVPVPSRAPELLGLTGIRGKVVPVFSLVRLLGFDSERSEARWLVFCGDRQTPIALAFEAMERLFEVPSTAIFARQEASGHRYVNATVGEGKTLRGVISIPALVEYIETRGANERRK
jgi:chemotaxis signal transduction protein